MIFVTEDENLFAMSENCKKKVDGAISHKSHMLDMLVMKITRQAMILDFNLFWKSRNTETEKHLHSRNSLRYSFSVRLIDRNKRQARGCNQLVDLTSEPFFHISVATFTQRFCCCWNDHFHSSWLYLLINR